MFECSIVVNGVGWVAYFLTILMTMIRKLSFSFLQVSHHLLYSFRHICVWQPSCNCSPNLCLLRCFPFISAECADSVLPAYMPIIERRKDIPFTEEHKAWQQLRRGRYVEFNLVSAYTQTIFFLVLSTLL